MNRSICNTPRRFLSQQVCVIVLILRIRRHFLLDTIKFVVVFRCFDRYWCSGGERETWIDLHFGTWVFKCVYYGEYFSRKCNFLSYLYMKCARLSSLLRRWNRPIENDRKTQTPRPQKITFTQILKKREHIGRHKLRFIIILYFLFATCKALRF